MSGEIQLETFLCKAGYEAQRYLGLLATDTILLLVLLAPTGTISGLASTRKIKDLPPWLQIL